ncbi:cytochrome P450 [Amycolatopsis samaneae]|uniref:Cytochrome P450 n=1 Tax=Amycolatopsis samaneae TaxID=664691 RepID=A0ABW5GWL1_9PSEU
MGDRKVARGDTEVGCPVSRDANGTWRITGYSAARAVLRAAGTVQAGLGIETVDKMPSRIRRPVLYRDGQEHREHRRQTARFFAPRRVDEAYRGVMERVADAQLARLRTTGSADLGDLGFELAIEVTSAVLGLTESRPGIRRRLEYFFPERFGRPGFTSLHGLHWVFRQLTGWSRIYFNDVRPAVRARKHRRRDDLISHLLDEGCKDTEILGECLTFAAAGMVTTREFVVLAAWHLFTDDALRAKYRASAEPERLAILHELLRLEPVIAQLRRRTTAEIHLDGTVLPKDALVHIQIDTANLDPAMVGDRPLDLRPGRTTADGVTGAGLAFGDGPHKCPGSPVAILETDIFLRKLLAVEGIHLATPPRVTFKEDIAAYELRGLRVAVA